MSAATLASSSDALVKTRVGGNTWGNSPQSVSGRLTATIVATDYLGFSSTANADAVKRCLVERVELLGGDQTATYRWLGHGKHWFDRTESLRVDGCQVGLVSWGGSQQRGWVHGELSGHGCGLISDWAIALSALRRLRDFRLKRVDLYRDTHSPALAFDATCDAYYCGHFDPCGAGRRPALTLVGTGSPRLGRTVMVGRRTSQKAYRGYEKSRAVAAKLPAVVAASYAQCSARPWSYDPYLHFRHELELKAVDSSLDEQILVSQETAFRRAYRYLDRVCSEPGSPVGARQVIEPILFKE